MLLETRAGTLTIRAPTAPVSFSVDGGKVEPGSGAVVEIGTAEPYELQDGRLLLTYDPAVASELPVVVTDPRHGDVSVTVTYPRRSRGGSRSTSIPPRGPSTACRATCW